MALVYQNVIGESRALATGYAGASYFMPDILGWSKKIVRRQSACLSDFSLNRSEFSDEKTRSSQSRFSSPKSTESRKPLFDNLCGQFAVQ